MSAIQSHVPLLTFYTDVTPSNFSWRVTFNVVSGLALLWFLGLLLLKQRCWVFLNPSLMDLGSPFHGARYLQHL